MHGPRVNPVVTGAVTVVVMLLVVAGIFVSGVPGGPQIPLFGGGQVLIKAKLSDADALAPHAGVQIAGVKIGEIRNVDADGNDAVVTMAIEPQYADIHSDAHVLLRPHGLFGPKYIELVPGTSDAPMLEDGQTIPETQSVLPVDLDQVLHELQAPERQQLKTAIVELGKAAAGRGSDVNHLVAAANTLTSTLDRPIQALDTVAPNLNDMLVQDEAFNADFAQTPLDQLVRNNNITLQAFATNAGHLESLLTHADSTLTNLDAALSGEGGNIRKTLETLPTTIDKLDQFNDLLSVFGADFTGKLPGASDITGGIIGAIENVRSAFSSGDACTYPGYGKPNPDNCTPSDHNFLNPNPSPGQEHYVRVETFGLNTLPGNDGSTPNPFAPLCGTTLPGGFHLPVCPSSSSSRPQGSGAVSGLLTDAPASGVLADLFAP